MSDPFPRLTIEFDHVRHSVVHAFMGRSDEVSNIIKEELDRMLQPENVATLIRQKVREAASLSMGRAIDDFFSYGPGREAMREAVYKELSARLREGDFKMPGERA